MYKHEKHDFIFFFLQVIWFKGYFSHNNYLSRKVIICSMILAKLTIQTINWMVFLCYFFLSVTLLYYIWLETEKGVPGISNHSHFSKIEKQWKILTRLRCWLIYILPQSVWRTSGCERVRNNEVIFPFFYYIFQGWKE